MKNGKEKPALEDPTEKGIVELGTDIGTEVGEELATLFRNL